MFMESPKFSVSKEAASIFKIISVIISFTPLLSSIIIGFIYTPKLFNGLLFLVIVIPCALLLPIFSIRFIRNYDFLFYVTSNSKAFFLFYYPVHSNNNRIKCLYQYCKRVRQGNRNNQCGNRNKISDVLRLPYHGDNVDLLIIEKEAS